jgi:hypothetical protein
MRQGQPGGAGGRKVALRNRADSRGWWRGLDSNQRRRSQRIYSPSPLATRAPLRTPLPANSNIMARRQHGQSRAVMLMGPVEVNSAEQARNARTALSNDTAAAAFRVPPTGPDIGLRGCMA